MKAKKVKLFLFADDMITYVENSIIYTQRGFPGGAYGKDTPANARNAET